MKRNGKHTFWIEVLVFAISRVRNEHSEEKAGGTATGLKKEEGEE